MEMLGESRLPLAAVLLLLLAIIPSLTLADARADELDKALRWKANEVPVPIMALGPCKTPPVIDGKLDPQEWAEANALSMLSNHGAAYAFPTALVYMTYDANRFYFGYLRYKEGPSWFAAGSRFRDSATYMDPHIELFLSPDPGTGKDLVYQFCINAYGAVYDIINMPAYGITSPGYNPKIQFKTSETQSEWYLEGYIDVKDLDPEGRFRDGAVWRANFCWAWPQIAWASRGGFWIVRDNMGVLKLDSTAPAVQWLDAYPLMEGQLDLNVAMKNRTDRPQTYLLAATVTGESPDNILARGEQKVELAPGERKELHLQGAGTFAGKRGHCAMTCTSAGGQTIYYQQYLRLDGKNAGARAKRNEAMKTDTPMPKTIALGTRFGQLQNALEVQADVWYLRRAGIDLDRVHVWVEPKAQPGRVILEKDLNHFQQDLALWKFDMPKDLPFGAYIAKAKALSKDGAVLAEAQSEFTRLDLASPEVNKPYRGRDGHILDWIGTKCGVATEVPPPWTPITGDPKKGLQVLERQITLDPSGLPRQIVSVGEPLLVGPVHFVAVVNGKPLALKAGKISRFTLDKAGIWASWEGTVSGKGLKLTSKARLEYDGFIQYQLEIACPKPLKVDALYLEMPVRKEIAERLNLPNSHLLLPAGDGVIWKSKEVTDNEVMNTLMSHIWLGNWKCGMTFIADQTKGWYEKMGDSLQTISRDTDAVCLRVAFVQGPQDITSTTLAFSLLPTPTRTREAGWRDYPRRGDKHYFWVMDWFDDRQYEGTASWPVWNWDDVSKEQLEKLQKQDRTNNPTLGLPYTNPWFAYPWVVPWVMGNGSPVFPIMNEDWANMPTRWGAVRPVASERDFMTYNYDFYFRTKHYGGFYIDEAYGAEKEDINMINGSGWLDRAGNLRGSYHSLDVRELFKRQYVIGMQYSPIGKPFMLNHTSWGMSPQYMSHVTCGVYVENLPIGPGEGYLDHMPLSTLQFWNGRAWGHFSDVTGVGPDAKSKRYCVGQLMLHDICCSSDERNPIRSNFGLGAADVQFFGYWEQPQVTTSSDPMIKASVYLRPKSALVVIDNVDTKTEHTALITLDAKTLGLPATVTITDYETGQPVPPQDGKIPVKLGARDVQYLHLTW